MAPNPTNDERAKVLHGLREAVNALALPAGEQVRVTLPGCVTCELLNDFDIWAREALERYATTLTPHQQACLRAIGGKMDEMTEEDYECCCTAEAALPRLERRLWCELRSLARGALEAFGWPLAAQDAYRPVNERVWRRAPLEGHGEGPEAPPGH
jgi:hypothetical protein